MPPEVSTCRARRWAEETASTMASTSSGTTAMESSGMPRARSRRTRCGPLASATLAVRISFPMITAAAPVRSMRRRMLPPRGALAGGEARPDRRQAERRHLPDAPVPGDPHHPVDPAAAPDGLQVLAGDPPLEAVLVEHLRVAAAHRPPPRGHRRGHLQEE